MIFRILLCLFLSLPIGATTFELQGLDEQIIDADGIIVGSFLKKKSVRLENGDIATQMIFKLNKEWGMQTDKFGLDEVIVHYPGGTLNGETMEISGIPSFIAGEKAALFIKNVNHRYWGMNLALGCYKIINYGHQTMLISALVPSHPKIGQVRLEEFEIKVKSLKGTGLRVVQLPQERIQEEMAKRAPASVEEGKKRAIASNTEEGENKTGQSNSSVFWLVGLLGISGGLLRLVRKGGPNN